MSDFSMLRDYLVPVVAQLEGPYKWHSLAAVGLLFTALITKFIFKTFKWILLLILLIALIAGGVFTLLQLTGS